MLRRARDGTQFSVAFRSPDKADVSVRSAGAWAGISRTGLTTGLTSSAGGTKTGADLVAHNRKL